jgi:Spy/CpxP family protein refolding chaperone
MKEREAGLSLGLCAALLLSAFTTLAWAAPAENAGTNKAKHEKMDGPGPDGEMEARMGQRLIADLNLTDDQIAKLKTERLNTRKQMIRDMAEMKTLHLDLFDETFDEKPDLDKIERLAKQIGELQTKMLLSRTKGMIFLRTILTPEQKRKFNEIHMRMSLDPPAGPWPEHADEPGRHEGPHPPGE